MHVKIGGGILLYHATGVVIGEMDVIGNNVLFLHNASLGRTGKESGDWGGCRDLGGAVGPRTTAVGNPARAVAGNQLYQILMEHLSYQCSVTTRRKFSYDSW